MQTTLVRQQPSLGLKLDTMALAQVDQCCCPAHPHNCRLGSSYLIECYAPAKSLNLLAFASAAAARIPVRGILPISAKLVNFGRSKVKAQLTGESLESG